MELDQLFPIKKTLVILLPDGTPSDWVLEIVGIDSTQFNRVSKRQATQRVAELEDELTPEERLDRNEARSHELYAACIAGWSGLTASGVEVPYSHDKAVELLSKPELLWVRQQVEKLVDQRAGFFRQGSPAA